MINAVEMPDDNTEGSAALNVSSSKTSIIPTMVPKIPSKGAIKPILEHLEKNGGVPYSYDETLGLLPSQEFEVEKTLQNTRTPPPTILSRREYDSRVFFV